MFDMRFVFHTAKPLSTVGTKQEFRTQVHLKAALAKEQISG